MPGRDGTGPCGEGSLTGRGLGICEAKEGDIKDLRGLGRGLGFGCRRRPRRFSRATYIQKDKEE
ncbi:DUF5320 domain-containing protein [Abyssisolibacter fermentans]|uniref:DUF5320 domain-containing protein n=1 Tax=Abyssisolibacter fermentans TaxID=1766203 RepID=UPI0008378207|nr:DUF5320 domain-containing protein [Abyssisolibacter fermentans]